MSRNKIKRLVSKNPRYPLNKVDALVALLKQLKKYSHHYYNGELYIQFEKTYLVYPNEYLISDIKRLLQNKWNATAEKYILPELRTRLKTKIETDNEPWNIYLSNGHFDTIKNRFVSIDEYEKDRFIIPVSPVPEGSLKNKASAKAGALSFWCSLCLLCYLGSIWTLLYFPNYMS